MDKIDLHIHTIASDGDLTLAQVCYLAKQNDVNVISITDHNYIAPFDVLKKASEKYNIKIIPGIEMDTNVKGIHILGYNIKNYELLTSFLNGNLEYNKDQNQKTIDSLSQQGIDISLSKVEQVAFKLPITYKDIARYLVQKGYAKDTRDVYKNFMGKGTKAYFPSYMPSVNDVLQIIQKCGGHSVLAHPSTVPEEIDLEELVASMTANGLKGIEVFNTNSNCENNQKFHYLAEKYGLTKTAGSDFHIGGKDKLGVDINLVKQNNCLKYKSYIKKENDDYEK